MGVDVLQQSIEARDTARAPRVCFVSTTFSSTSARLRYRQVMLAVEAGYDVSVVAPGPPEFAWEGVTFVRQPYIVNRRKRMLRGWKSVLAAWRTDADLYVFYELEIQPFALLFKLLGKKVIVDIFEDNPSAMIIKAWIPTSLKQTIAWATHKWESFCARVWDGVMSADPGVFERFRFIPENRRAIVYNYPYLPHFDGIEANEPEYDIVYIGGLSIPRGTLLLANAVQRLREQGTVCKVIMIGSYLNDVTQEKVEAFLTRHKLWDQFTFAGQLPYPEAMRLLPSARIGVVPFEKGIRKYQSNIPSKMFDYWAAGLPVVVTDFDSARRYILRGSNGFVVPAGDANALANAIKQLLTDTDIASKLGDNGRNKVHEEWNAQGPENKSMLTLFKRVLNRV